MAIFFNLYFSELKLLYMHGDSPEGVDITARGFQSDLATHRASIPCSPF